VPENLKNGPSERGNYFWKEFILGVVAIVPDPNLAISSTYSGRPVLRWAAIWDVTSL
jgi:hypothetical protein